MKIPPQGYRWPGAIHALALAATLASPGGSLLAHPEIEDQIAGLSTVIRDAGKDADADAFLQRGELYRVHEDWNLALADFKRALSLDPSLEEARCCRGRLFLEKGEPRRALEDLDAFLISFPADPRGLALRAKANAALGKNENANADYAAAVCQSDSPPPQLVLEWADFRIAVDRTKGGVESALAALDRGIERAGPLVTLQTRAIDLECDRKNFTGALARIEATMAANGTTPLWLKRKAEVLALAGRRGDAIRAYRETLARLDGLPEARRNVRAVRAMREHVALELKWIVATTQAK